jgi:hypothetical protein
MERRERKKRLSPIYLVRGLLQESFASVAPDLTVEDLCLQPLPIITHANILEYFDNNRRGDDLTNWMVQTQILRHRSNLHEYFYPRYQLLCVEPAISLLMAVRPHFFSMNLEIYDVQAGCHGAQFVPSSRMYVGTLECVSLEQGIYRLVRHQKDGSYIQLAAFMSFRQDEAIGSVRLWKAIVPDAQVHEDELTSKDEALEKILVEVHRKYRLLPRGYSLFRSQKPVFETMSKKHFAYASSGVVQKMAKAMPPSLKNCNLRSCDGREKAVCNLTKHATDIFHCDFARPMTTINAFAFALCQLQTHL